MENTVNSDNNNDITQSNNQITQTENIINHHMNMSEDMTKLILSMGSNASRYMLKSLVNHFNRLDLFDVIDQACSVHEIGCYQVNYINKFSNEKETVYILISPCTKDHNLTEQLDKLKIYISDSEWSQVLKSLSTLILLTRTIYHSIYMDNKNLFNDIVDDDKEYSTLSVDLSNTTLYLHGIPERIGIFIERS